MDNDFVPKNAEKYYCKNCNFECSKKSNYTIHLSTAKHKRITMDNDFVPKNATSYMCLCGNKYKYSSGLSKHKKKCTYIPEDTEFVNDTKLMDVTDMDKVIKSIMRDNKDMMIEIIQKIQPTTTNNTVNNTTNYFNIQMFLNEECKDAMNMSEFIESIQLSLEDMENFTSQGQTNGMANILINKLNNIDLFKRPMHCSDVKKETIYIKDEDKWEIEAIGRPKLRHALDRITKKSIETLPAMSDNPDECVKTVNEVLKIPREDDKIIAKVASKMFVKK